jgi:uncharacterized protein (TIGR02172 family)
LLSKNSISSWSIISCMKKIDNLGKPIARGRTADVYAWSQNRVLKLYYDWLSAGSIEREYQISRQAFDAGVPVPQPFELIKIENRLGIVFERVNGPTMLQLLLKQPWKVAKFSRELAEIHSSIHRTPLIGVSSYKETWLNNIMRVSGIPDEVKNKLIEKVKQFPELNQLCHFDLHPDQVIYTDKGALILDWMTACSGDPAADVARTKILLTIGKPPDASWFMLSLIDILGSTAYHFYLKRYLELNPDFDRNRIDDWFAPVAAVRLLEGIEFEEGRLRKIVGKAVKLLSS